MKNPTKLTKENLKEIDTFDKLLDLRYGKKGTETRNKFEEGVKETLKESTKEVGKNSEDLKNSCIFIKLLEEIPSDTIVFKTVSGKLYNAQNIIDGFKLNSELSKIYMSNFLRISRDILKRQAQK